MSAPEADIQDVSAHVIEQAIDPSEHAGWLVPDQLMDVTNDGQGGWPLGVTWVVLYPASWTLGLSTTSNTTVATVTTTAIGISGENSICGVQVLLQLEIAFELNPPVMEEVTDGEGGFGSGI
jgi:hypothetical protein